MVLCCFEGERWLPALLASIADQTLLPDELVVCDDGSTDRSVAIVERFAETAPFTVRIERNPERLGSTRNFAHGLSLAHGRVVALADQDDVWYPGKLAVMAWEFEQDPTISMVFSDADLMDSSGTPLGRKLWDTRLVGRTLRRHAVVPEDLFARRALTTGCTMAFRRRVVDAALPFPEELDDPWAPMRHDRWLSLVAAAVGTVRAIEEPLLAFRVHPNQETGVLVGSQLHRALARAASRVGRHSTKHEHAGRAAQLRAAAQRADLVGDFREAATLRTVAEHQAARAAIGEGNQRASDVVRAALAGAYRGDPLSPLAVGADLVRSVLPAVDAPREPAP